MKRALYVFMIAAVFGGVYGWRRSTVPSQVAPSRPAGLPPPPANTNELPPGSPVTITLGRGALRVDGDAADPIETVELFKLVRPKGPDSATVQKIKIDSSADGWKTPDSALWFFDVDPAATYCVEVKTRFRKEFREIAQDPATIHPLEIARIRMRVKTSDDAGPPVSGIFSPDAKQLTLVSNSGDVKCIDVQTSKETTGAIVRISPGPATDAVLASSADGVWRVKNATLKGSIRLLRISKSGEETPVFTIPHPLIAMSNDGRFIAVLDEKNMSVEIGHGGHADVDVDVIVFH